MATVTGLTAARMLAIEAASVISGLVSGNNLILTKRDGTTINAGNVRGPQGIQGVPGSITVSPAGGALAGNYPNPTLASATAQALMPTGSILPYAGSTHPTGFLVANGQQISRTTYAALFAVIGTTYGVGDGGTTFNLPNLTARFPRGALVPGVAGGSATKTIGITNLPAHTHGEAGQHDHELQMTPSVGSLAYPVRGQGTSSVTATSSKPVVGAGAHTHASVGGNTPLDITPPYIDLLFIIKT